METLSDMADLRLDTTQTHIHEFRASIATRVARRSTDALSLQFCSFGYKNGVPPEADFVFDCRCLPNPYWDPTLREFSGRDEPIQNFLHGDPIVERMVTDIIEFLSKWIPAFEAENRSYLTVALGCTGGRHRSVFVAERISEHFKTGRSIMLVHRDG
jgi:UPF0042 nucleotide-binding protein